MSVWIAWQWSENDKQWEITTASSVLCVVKVDLMLAVIKHFSNLYGVENSIIYSPYRRVFYKIVDFWFFQLLCVDVTARQAGSIITSDSDIWCQWAGWASPLSIHQFNDILNFKASELSQSKLHSFPLTTINQKCGQPAATPPMEPVTAEGADKGQQLKWWLRKYRAVHVT